MIEESITAIGISFQKKYWPRRWADFLYLFMRIVVQLPEQENNKAELFEFLRIRGGKWTSIPDAEELAIPGNKALSYEQFEAIIDASMASESINIQTLSQQLKQNFSSDRD